MARRTRKQRQSSLGQSRAVLDGIAKAFAAEPIIYATSTRQRPDLFGAVIATDVLPVFAEHLDRIGMPENLALLLHTHGGSLDAPWPLVNMLRSHVTENGKLLVLVPEAALSAGTLIALGADEIYMDPHAFLSPVDPMRSQDVGGKKTQLATEDVVGYVDFVTARVGIRDQTALVEALKELTKEVPATVLGNIHRTCSLIERLSRNMLELHLTDARDRKRIEQIVDMLTHSLFTHSHLIPPREAKHVIGLGDMVRDPSRVQRRTMVRAHSFLLKEMQCREPFDPDALLRVAAKPAKEGGKVALAEVQSTRALVASRYATHAFISKYRLSRTEAEQIQIKPIGASRWERVE